jgi:hypothetical protein
MRTTNHRVYISFNSKFRDILHRVHESSMTAAKQYYDPFRHTKKQGLFINQSINQSINQWIWSLKILIQISIAVNSGVFEVISSRNLTRNHE